MFAEVVFPLPFRNSFTYKIPKSLKGIQERVRVIAPFGKRILTGFIVSLSEEDPEKTGLKELIDVLDDEPVLSEAGIKFYRWLSDYYICSLGEAVKLAVPYGFDIESKKRIISDKDYCASLLDKTKNKESIKAKVLSVLSERSQIGFTSLQKATGKRNIYSVVRSLAAEGAISVLDEMSGERAKPKKKKYVRLSISPADAYDNIPLLEERSPAQVKILLELMTRKSEVPLVKLLAKTRASGSSAASLQKKGFIEVFEKAVERRYSEHYSEEKKEVTLTGAQKEIVDEVSGDIRSGKFAPYLLFGVTGSGKTQVYLELAKEALAAGKSVIILVPEISLTPQITSRFISAFGEQVSVVHSRMSKGERYDTWRRIKEGRSSIIIGARSALFSPVAEPGLIVVDEEHDQSYKQSDTIPRYNARDAAVMLASSSDCPVILGSATPSVESMHNAQTGKYRLLRLPERIDNARMPVITLVNLLKEQKQSRIETVFSRTLLDKIEDRLKKREGIIILQNRRGFSTQVYCSDCGTVEKCDNCSVPMVFHIGRNILECHYCGFLKKVPSACSHCGSLSIKFFGTGTERVEDEIEYFFPSARIRRVDSDAVSRKNSLSRILNEFGKGETDILIGTQMVSKGLDFPRVTLVGVIAAETSLWLPDFRADERTFQLLTQVAGRAGRSRIEGEVLIQTRNEKNFALQKVLQNDYEGFFQHEISLRKLMSYPPFSRLCLIEFKDLDEENAKNAALEFAGELMKYRNVLKLTPPSPALISRIKGYYRYHILIKSPRETDPGGALLRKAVTDSVVEFNKISRYRDIRYIIDMDPQSVF